MDNVIPVGTPVWIADWVNTDTWKPCPVCFGKKRVQVILGDDTVISVPCRYCEGNNFEPQGQVKCGHWAVGTVKIAVVTGYQVDTREDGSLYTRYYFNMVGYGEERVGRTKEEALAKAQVQADAANARRDTERAAEKYRDGKTYAWNAGYYREQAEYHRRQAAIYDKKAVVMESRIRKPKND